MTCQEGKTRAIKFEKKEKKKTRSPLKHIISFIAKEKFCLKKEEITPNQPKRNSFSGHGDGEVYIIPIGNLIHRT